MSKQLIFVIGAPYSGRSTWVNKNLFNPNDSVHIDANSYSNLYTKSKDNVLRLSEDSIEESRLWCLQEVKTQMEGETPTQKIVLSLIACRPDRWREFIQLAITNGYEISFKTPTNKFLFYYTKHNNSMEQFKFIESKVLYRYPRDTKEVQKKGSKNPEEVEKKVLNESALLKNVVTESESAHAFYLTNRTSLGTDKEKWLGEINKHYKVAISNLTKRAEKKAEKEAKTAEKEARKIAREAEAEEEIKKEVGAEEVEETVKVVVEQTEQVVEQVLA